MIGVEKVKNDGARMKKVRQRTNLKLVRPIVCKSNAS